MQIFAPIAACVLALSACNAPAPDVEQLIDTLSAAGMNAAPDPSPLPAGVSAGDLQDIAKLTGARMEFLVVERAKVTVLRFKSEAAAKKFEEHDREKKAKQPTSTVPQWKPTRVEGRVKNFMLTLYPRESEDEAALRATLARIEKALTR